MRLATPNEELIKFLALIFVTIVKLRGTFVAFTGRSQMGRRKLKVKSRPVSSVNLRKRLSKPKETSVNA